MQISSISNNNSNFGQTMPILKILTMGANGQEVSLRTLKSQHGPMYAFIRRLNNDQYCPEGIFLRKKLSLFREYPFVSSTSMATPKRYLVFGESDISAIRDLCINHYRNGDYTKETIIDIIKRKFIEPLSKKYKFCRYQGDKIGEPVGLVLHANKVKKHNGKGKTYNFGIDITNETGNHVYAVLPSALPEVAKLQPPIKLPKLEQGEFNFN